MRAVFSAAFLRGIGRLLHLIGFIICSHTVNRCIVFSAIRAVFSAAFVRGIGGLLRPIRIIHWNLSFGSKGCILRVTFTKQCNYFILYSEIYMPCHHGCFEYSIRAWYWQAIASKSTYYSIQMNKGYVFSAIRAIFIAAFLRGIGGPLRLIGFPVCNRQVNRQYVFSAIRAVFSAAFLRGIGSLLRVKRVPSMLICK